MCSSDLCSGAPAAFRATANRAASTKLRRTSMELQSNQRANVDVESGHDGQQVDTSGARVMEFLQKHTAYELIPESNKVVVLDTKLPIRQAFHAFYEQGIYAAPLWDEDSQDFVGLLSAGDFIDIPTYPANAAAPIIAPAASAAATCHSRDRKSVV